MRAAALLALLALTACHPNPPGSVVRNCSYGGQIVERAGRYWYRPNALNGGAEDQPIAIGAPLDDVCARQST